MTLQRLPSRSPGVRPGQSGTVRAPSFWAVTWNTVRRLVKGPRAVPPPNAARDSSLLDACVAIRAGRIGDAGDLLAAHADALANDPAYLNLVGVIAELRGQWKHARRFYGVAISIAPNFPPPQQNMRRLYELYTFGRSQEPVALGDGAIRRDRALPSGA